MISLISLWFSVTTFISSAFLAAFLVMFFLRVNSTVSPFFLILSIFCTGRDDFCSISALCDGRKEVRWKAATLPVPKVGCR